MFVTMKEVLLQAQAGGYGVAAPNVRNEDTVRACIAAAEQHNAPIIIGPGFRSHPDLGFLARMIIELARQSSVPIAINLDHGASPEQCYEAMRVGFTSVMIDASTLPFDQNVETTKSVTTVAHALCACVEAELGHVGQGIQYETDRDAALTDPSEARAFVEQTQVDALAVAIGTAHGAYSGTPKLDFPRLERIRAAVSVPLVLHGGSGTGDDNLRKACALGICKVNLATDLYASAGHSALEYLSAGGHGMRAYEMVTQGYQDMLSHYLEVIGSVGKA